MEKYTALKSKKTLPFEKTWMNMKGIPLNEVEKER